MSRKEKKIDCENAEKRESARLDDHRSISVEDVKAGMIHRAKMLNYSKTGMYFESDSVLQPGARIYLGIGNSSDATFADEFECKLAEIVWRNELKKSFYNYGYGVQFLGTDSPQQKEQQIEKKAIDSRKHPRKAYAQPVLLATNDQILKAVSENISPQGIFLKADSKIEVGQKIIVSLPTRSKKRLTIRAEVIWAKHEGCGVKFLRKIN